MRESVMSEGERRGSEIYGDNGGVELDMRAVLTHTDEVWEA